MIRSASVTSVEFAGASTAGLSLHWDDDKVSVQLSIQAKPSGVLLQD